jgi:hypothetical protein
MGIKMFTAFMISRGRLAALSLLSALLLLGEAACQRVPLLAPSGSVITLTSSATVLPFNGSTLIQAQVIEASGSPPHSGTHVTFTTTLGAIQPSDGETDSSGLVKVTFVAGAQSGTATITAISGGASVSATGAVKILVGAAAVGRVNVSANPATVPATGGSTTISASVLDVNGNQLSSVPVSFVTTAGTLSASQVITDSNGIAQTTLTTVTSATVTASVGAQGSTTPPATGGGGGTGGTTPTTPTSGQASGSVTVNISAAPTLVITPPTAPPNAGVPASFTFAVTVASSNGSAIRDLAVDWGDMSNQDLGAVTGNAVVSHVYAAPGTYSVVGTLQDAFGNTVTARTAVSVITAASPTVIVTAPTVPNPLTLPFTANFTIQVTPPTGIGISNVSVCWGDTTPCVPQSLGGLTGSATVPHTYFVGHQTFPVTVTATDTSGRQTPGTTTITLP